MRKRWHLILLILLLVAVVNIFALRSYAEESSDPAPDTTVLNENVDVPSDETEDLPAEPDAPAESLPVSNTYDPAVEGIVTAYYHVDTERGFLLGVGPGTAGDLLCHVCLPENIALSTEVPVTGTVLNAPGEVEPLTGIVTGDLNGDGAVTITDMLLLKSSILGETLSSEASAAADINFDGNITITDFLRVKSSLLGLEQIRAGHPANSESEENIILLTPGTNGTWQLDITSDITYASGNESLFLIDELGQITAGDVEGSAFAYALNQDGQALSRILVSVIREGMEVYLERVETTMFPGFTQTPAISFNHPFTQSVDWTSSDAETVSVDENGVILAHKVGSATITVSLANGNTASVDISVIPPITAMEIERTLYKVKPGDTKSVKLITEPVDVEEEFIWESSDPSIATVGSDGTVTGVSYGTVTITAKGKYSGLTATCQVKVCNVKQVALTFDDGPSPYTERLLDFLKENDIRVTFFLVANRIPSYKEETIREVQEGHEIGYHSYAHDMQPGLTTERITSDFVKSNAMLKELTGAEFTVWRTPGGSYNQRVLDAVELPHILWSLDTVDWKSLNADAVCSKILGAKDGHIVLIHDLHRTSVQGAIKAMEIMMEGDYEFLTVTELLSRDGTPPENSVNYNSAMR